MASALEYKCGRVLPRIFSWNECFGLCGYQDIKAVVSAEDGTVKYYGRESEYQRKTVRKLFSGYMRAISNDSTQEYQTLYRTILHEDGDGLMVLGGGTGGASAAVVDPPSILEFESGKQFDGLKVKEAIVRCEVTMPKRVAMFDLDPGSCSSMFDRVAAGGKKRPHSEESAASSGTRKSVGTPFYISSKKLCVVC